MQSLKDIRQRIAAIKNMQKVTRAMKLVAAAKLRKAQRDALSARYYTDNLRDIIVGISKRAGYQAPPIMRRRSQVRSVDLLVVTSERGLCGTFNENLLRSTLAKIEDHRDYGIDINIFTVGKKGWQFFKSKNVPTEKLELLEGGIGPTAHHIAGVFTQRFLTEQSDGAYIALNRFFSTARQEVSFWDFLPLHWRGTARDRYMDYTYEPGREETIEQLTGEMLARSVFQAFLESNAAELAARIMAMDKATKNADDMISLLTLQYHKARQASITAELLDIVGGAEALQ